MEQLVSELQADRNKEKVTRLKIQKRKFLKKNK